MKAVIGTAGHVDHGKTALIKALTGITTARPVEQARGMTLDLGFAHFDDDDGNTVGVIDVPGHERFIRNMVAGVWSLDLVLLVVAADEGWMPMTTDHLKVAHAMGIRNIILCINKSDTVDTETLALVEEDALEHCLAITDEIPESITVSALTGENINALRKMVLRQLRQVERQPLGHSAHLYIDRVFTVNGIGTVVTGSLADGSLKIGDRLKMYPSGKDVQVRTLQSYHRNLDEAEPVSRVAVGLKGVTRKELERGCCIAGRDALCQVTDRLFVRLEEGADTSRRNREVEVALGTWNGLARLVYIKDTRLALLKLDKPVPCFWGQSMAMIRHGGSELIHSGRIVWTSDVAMHLRKRLQALLNDLPETLAPSDQLRLSLDLNGYAPLAAVADGDAFIDSSDYLALGDWLVSRTFSEALRERILKLLDGEGIAMTLVELSTRLSVNVAVMEQVLQGLKDEDKIRMSKDAWMAGGGASEDDLGHDGQQLLGRIRAAGKDGFEADKEKVVGGQKLLRNLVRLGFVVAFEGKIYYATELYDQLLRDILAGFGEGERFGINLARERTGLSRKYIIPLLNKMELDRWVRRDDNDRIVLKLPDVHDKAA
ncbi:selenocysteine-specific translation elongation factor [Kistimonas asteriae]|uniref:selenocysteine-specific translation elongation factor n=1 Tax=Kistimonas asteriae TaxID=517724 RepID=UPI001BAD1E63|nr:selenocysteine-specific translation elongation factor [Kistimonas asteriae]